MLLLAFVPDMIVVSGLTPKHPCLNLTCCHLRRALKDIHALYNTATAILFEKRPENLGMPPWPTLQRAKCTEWTFGCGRGGDVWQPAFICLCSCVICALPKPSIHSKLEQLLPPRLPFPLPFIKNGSVDSTVYVRINVMPTWQDVIMWLFHLGLAEGKE